MNIWVLSRNLEEVQHTQTSEHEMSTDYITMDPSRFDILDNDITYKKGDFLIGKFEDTSLFSYFGIITSKEDNTFVTKSLLALLDFEIPTARIKGPSFETHVRDLIYKYLVNDPTKNLNNLVIDVETNTPHNYQPKEPPSQTNMTTYMINGFKKYNVVWEFVRVKDDKIYTVLKRVTKKVHIKNNVDYLYNWSFSNTEVGVGVANQLLIVDKTTNDMMNPKILSTWYINEENELTQNADDPKIYKPTKTVVNIYDTTEEKKPAYKDVADEELKGATYSHEIQCTMRRGNLLISDEDLLIGTLYEIVYDGETYQSVIAGYSFSDDITVELRFGHIRSRLSEILE